MDGRKCPGREKTAASWLMGNSRRSDSFWKLLTEAAALLSDWKILILGSFERVRVSSIALVFY